MNAGDPQAWDRLHEQFLFHLERAEQYAEQMKQAQADALTPEQRRRRFRLIKGAGAVVTVPLAWVHSHAAQTAVAAAVGVISGIGTGGLVGTMVTPADAEARQQPHQGQPYEGAIEVFNAPRPATRVSSSSGPTQGAVPSPTATTPLPTGTPGPAPARHDAMPNPTPLQGAASPLEPEPGLAPPTSTPTPTVTPTPTPTPTPNAGLTRKAAVLECVGEPGGEPPQDLVACVDSLLAGS